MNRRTTLAELRAQVDELIAELEQTRADLEQALANSTLAATVMYRRGYLAGHTAARRNHTTRRGPYRTRSTT